MNDKITVTLYKLVLETIYSFHRCVWRYIPNIDETMVLGIWSVSLILLVQSIGLFVEGENGARGVDNSCRLLKKLESPCDRRPHLGSVSSPVKSRCTFYDHNNENNILTFYHNFTEEDGNKEYRVSLFRGINKTSRLCEGSFNATKLPFDSNNCRVIPSASQVTFHLQSLNDTDTDIYFFCKEDMYPPPYICECDEGTIIHVKELKLDKEVIEIQKMTLSGWIILGCIIPYSLIITILYVSMWRNRRRKRIQQSEYINVVPRRPKNHKPYIPYATDPVRDRIR